MTGLSNEAVAEDGREVSAAKKSNHFNQKRIRNEIRKENMARGNGYHPAGTNRFMILLTSAHVFGIIFSKGFFLRVQGIH